jgi:hypothetical protein
VVLRAHVGGGFYLAEAVDRFFYYPETLWPEGTYGHWAPTLWVDGRDQRTAADSDVIRQWGDYKNMITARREVPSPLLMDLVVEYGDRGDTATAHVQVVAEDTVAFNDLHLRMAVIESGLIYKGTFHEVARDYIPDISGIYFTIAQGDTFIYAQDFIWDEMWITENGRVVAFVQDDENRDVLQAIQKPMLAPVPQVPGDVAITLAGEDLRLDWSPVNVDTGGIPLTVDRYHVYRDTLNVFAPGLTPLASTPETYYLDQTAAVGNSGLQYFYWVTAVAGLKESEHSLGLGEFDRGLTAGK